MRAVLAALLLVSCAAPPPPPPAAHGAHGTGRPITPPVAAASAKAEELPAPPPPRSPFAYANIDPDDDYVVGPPDVRATCDEDLAAAGIKFQPAALAVHKEKKNKFECGAPQVVTYRGSPAKIAYSPSVLVTCTMALALARLETIVQEESQRIFGKRVVKIQHIGTYNCREMAAYKGWVSEHSYANAIDLTHFVLEDGRVIEVLKDFKPKLEKPQTKEGEFLRAVARRAYDEETFSCVLTPYFDKLHANHFHIDLARFRSDGTRFPGE